MIAQYILDYVPFNREFEGNILWMYLDSDEPGNVTCGNGFLIPSALIACAYPFYTGSLRATSQEIQSAWKSVKAMIPGHRPPYYRYPGCLTLRQEDVDAHLLTLLAQTDDNLRRDFPGYDGFPDCVKMALLDMDFNLGDQALRTTYIHFDPAVDARNWTVAAQECFRHGIGANRNKWTQEQFIIAAKLPQPNLNQINPV